MHGKNNIGLICMTLLLYVLNQIYKTSFENEAIRWFMCCYFNDIIGGVTFLAYTNLMLKFLPITFCVPADLIHFGGV